MLNFASQSAGCMVFSKVDLSKGYQQIPMHWANIAETAVATPFGLFEFLCLLFGLKNVGSMFQYLMDKVVWGLLWCFWCLGDIIVTSFTLEEHLIHLKQLFLGLPSTVWSLLPRSVCLESTRWSSWVMR
jgi:cytoskeleton-associated protein 5